MTKVKTRDGVRMTAARPFVPGIRGEMMRHTTDEIRAEPAVGRDQPHSRARQTSRLIAQLARLGHTVTLTEGAAAT